MARRDVLSPTPGSVWLQSVAVGQQVAEGTVILILECMKTEIPVEAPCAGTIAWLAQCGDVVERDTVVATIDE